MDERARRVGRPGKVRGRAAPVDDCPGYVRKADGDGPGAVCVAIVIGRWREDGALRLARIPADLVRRDDAGNAVGTFWTLRHGEVYQITNANGVTWFATPRDGCCLGLFASEVEAHAREMDRRYGRR